MQAVPDDDAPFANEVADYAWAKLLLDRLRERLNEAIAQGRVYELTHGPEAQLFQAAAQFLTTTYCENFKGKVYPPRRHPPPPALPKNPSAAMMRLRDEYRALGRDWSAPARAATKAYWEERAEDARVWRKTARAERAAQPGRKSR